MSLDAHLIHRCTIQRPVERLDAYNNAAKAWDEHLTNVACRLVTKAQAVRRDDTAQLVTVTRYTLLLPAGADVQVDDRVVDLVLEDGSQDPGPYHIAAVLPRRTRAAHHLSLALDQVS